MQNPNEDTEWNDVLRAKGIIPQKEKEVSEEAIVDMMEKTIKDRNGKKELEDMTLDELDELEDEEEERILEQYRRERIREIRAQQSKNIFGSVREISGQDYVDEVTKAGDGIRVVLHLYKQGIPLCAVINQHMSHLAAKFPAVKFLKSISTTCIPNYPDKNLPTLFVYFEGQLKSQLVGPESFRGTAMTVNEFEYILGKAEAVETDIKDDPRPAVHDVMMASLGGCNRKGDSSDDNDW